MVPLSDEVRMVPLEPTTTCDGLEVVVVGVSLLLLQEERRRMKEMRRMSRCFTRFPISGLGEPEI